MRLKSCWQCNYMREIKFRAWKKFENRFYTQEEMNEIGGYYYTHRVDNEWDEYPIQQYTGLKDKNGKEIYEGDILSAEGWSNVVIKWEDAQSFSLSEEYGQYAYDFTIIGNIYENKELINK